MCVLFVSGGKRRPLALATADRADAYKQLPLLGEDVLAAVVTLKTPQMVYGMASHLGRSTFDILLLPPVKTADQGR